MFDNVLWEGHVADPNARVSDPDTAALYQVVMLALKDKRFRTHSIMFSDGLAIAQKI